MNSTGTSALPPYLPKFLRSPKLGPSTVHRDVPAIAKLRQRAMESPRILDGGNPAKQTGNEGAKKVKDQPASFLKLS